MLKAHKTFVKVEVENDTKVFNVANGILKRGKIISVGDGIGSLKKGQTVLFNSEHGKAMKDTEGGKDYWYVDNEIILAYE